MALPTIFNEAFRYATGTCTNSTAICTLLESELVTNGSWTKNTTLTYSSPADAAGRFVQIVCTTPAATKLDIAFTDMFGISIASREIQLDASQEVRIYSGAHHCAIDAIRAATPESIGVVLTDPSPDTIYQSVNNYVYAWGHRNTSGTAGAASNTFEFFCRTMVGSTIDSGYQVLSYNFSNATGGEFKNINGDYICIPVEVSTGDSTNDGRCAGMLYQCILTDDTPNIGDELVISMDGSTTGTFKICAKTAIGNRRIAWRKA